MEPHNSKSDSAVRNRELPLTALAGVPLTRTTSARWIFQRRRWLEALFGLESARILRFARRGKPHPTAPYHGKRARDLQNVDVVPRRWKQPLVADQGPADLGGGESRRSSACSARPTRGQPPGFSTCFGGRAGTSPDSISIIRSWGRSSSSFHPQRLHRLSHRRRGRSSHHPIPNHRMTAEPGSILLALGMVAAGYWWRSRAGRSSARPRSHLKSCSMLRTEIGQRFSGRDAATTDRPDLYDLAPRDRRASLVPTSVLVH